MNRKRDHAQMLEAELSILQYAQTIAKTPERIFGEQYCNEDDFLDNLTKGELLLLLKSYYLPLASTFYHLADIIDQNPEVQVFIEPNDDSLRMCLCIERYESLRQFSV